MRYAISGSVLRGGVHLEFENRDLFLTLFTKELAVFSLLIRRSARLVLPENVMQSHYL